jgi:hypothetical protein
MARAGSTAVALVAVTVLVLPLTSCGKRGEPTPPPGTHATYPLTYPRD